MPVTIKLPAIVELAPAKVKAVVVPDLIIRLPETLVALPNVVPPSLKNMSPPSASNVTSPTASIVTAPLDAIYAQSTLA